MKPIKISFFYLENNEGICLKDDFFDFIKNSFQNLNIELNSFSSTNSSQMDLSKSSLYDDIVIFDGSIENTHNYNCATAQPMALEHILVVSRTYLPINFTGIRTGGYPEYPNQKTNKEILSWLKKQLKDLLLKSPRKNKGVLKYFSAIFSSHDYKQNILKHRFQIFISYRSRHEEKVKKLASRLENGEFHDGNKQKVFFLPPGDLTYQDEIFPEFIWWQLQTFIDNHYMNYANEVWIFNDADNDYFKSWWTQGEIVSLAYRNSKQRIVIFNETKQSTNSDTKDYSITISKQDKKKLARLFSNSDINTMGPEARTSMKNWRQLPIIGKAKYFNDHIWTDEYWDYYLLPCKKCANNNIVNIDEFNIDYFIQIKEMQDVKKLSKTMLEDALNMGSFNCKCGAEYRITKNDKPRYLWYAKRGGKNTSPNGDTLEKLPVYRVERIK